LISNIENSRLLDVFPCLRAVSSREWTDAQPLITSFPAKTHIFQKDDAAKYGMFLLRGTARITLIGENGSESVLNVLLAGEVCGLLVLSGLSGRDYPGSIIAETDVEALFVLKSSFLRWVQEYELIRNAIFGSLLDGMLRMSELLQLRQSEPLDTRLARALLRVTSETQPLLYTTHHELASEIGSAREVVTRALQRYQRQGWVVTGRGWIRIAHRSELEALLSD
jgi:CRP/FNR family transcriptional regulator